MNRTSRSRATIDDVARLAGVSTATVSRVLNNTGTVAQTTADRVYAAISELNYVAHAAARGLAGSCTNTLGLILPDTSTLFLSFLLRGINTCANDNGYNLLIYATKNQVSIQSGNPLPLGEHNTDGLIIFTDSVDDESIRQLHQRAFPMVLLHRTPPAGLEIPCVMFENEKGAFDLVEHLITVCNHRKIGFLAGPVGNEDSELRYQGYVSALQKHHLPLNPDWVRRGFFDTRLAERVVSDWIQEGLECDAIFAGDDNMAIAAVTALRQAGLRIPEDVAVAGFNDDALSRHLNPPLTTVFAPTEAVGHQATYQLLHLIRGEAVNPLTRLETQVVVRASCGCPFPLS